MQTKMHCLFFFSSLQSIEHDWCLGTTMVTFISRLCFCQDWCHIFSWRVKGLEGAWKCASFHLAADGGAAHAFLQLVKFNDSIQPLFISPRNNLIRNFALWESLCPVTIVGGRTKRRLEYNKEEVLTMEAFDTLHLFVQCLSFFVFRDRLSCWNVWFCSYTLWLCECQMTGFHNFQFGLECRKRLASEFF